MSYPLLPGHAPACHLPLIDLTGLLGKDPQARIAVAEEIGKACRSTKPPPLPTVDTKRCAVSGWSQARRLT